MSIVSDDLIRWLNTLSVGTLICIDEGGLSLQVVGSPDTYLEVGGIPSSEEEDATVYCPSCESEVRDDVFNRTSLADHGRCVDCQREWLDVGDKDHPRSDWRYEVMNGDTSLGYVEWVEHKHESED